jgi:hypothetical protein
VSIGAAGDSVVLHASHSYHHCQCSRSLLFDLPQRRFGLPRTFIDHSWKTYMAHWTPNSLTQMQSFDHIENHSRSVPATLLCFPHHEPLLHPMRLELGELLGGLSASGQNTEDVEANGLGKRPALANDDRVTRLDTESGGDVCGEVLVALLVTGVLGDEVEVFTADDQGACSRLVCTAKTNFDMLHSRSCAQRRMYGETYGASWWT